MISLRSLLPSLPLVLAALLAPPAGGQTDHVWGKQFDTSDLPYSGTIYDALVFDDGSGLALYIAGQFQEFNGEIALSIVRFDGEEWSPVGEGLFDTNNPAVVRTLESYDPDGAGPLPPVLVAGGKFRTANAFTTTVNNVAAWDGSTWSALGGGIDGPIIGQTVIEPEIYDLQVFDDGSGPRLYATGTFRLDGFQGIAVFDGSIWSPVASTGMAQDYGLALGTYDDGTGEALYVGGRFNAIIGTPNTNRIARFDGTAWSGVTAGTFGEIDAFELYDRDGSGPAPEVLVAAVGGSLDVYDGQTVTRVTGFNGSTTPGLTVYDDGTGPAVYLGANSVFSTAGNRMHRWDGVAATLSPIADELQPILGQLFQPLLFVYRGELYGGGLFSGTVQAPVKGLLRFDNGTWVEPFARRGLSRFNPAAGSSSSLSVDVRGAVVFDGGSGERLIVGGQFTHAGAVSLDQPIAAWNGQNWSALPSIPTAGTVETLRPFAVWDDGFGAQLYVGVEAAEDELWRYDGSSWSEVGASTSSFTRFPTDLAIYDDGQGEDLYVAAGADLWRFDSGAWSIAGQANLNFLRELEVFDAPGGPQIYAGGVFQDVNGVAANNIARFDGTNWSAVGAGTNGSIDALLSFDDGQSTRLIVGGIFSSAGGLSGTSRIAAYDGTQWSALSGSTSTTDRLLGTYSDGIVNRLYTLDTGIVPAFLGASVRTYDGTTWTDLQSSLFTNTVAGLTTYDSGTGSAAFFYGAFGGSGGDLVGAVGATIDTTNQSGGIVRFGRPSLLEFSFCFGNGGAQAGCTSCPCGNNDIGTTLGGCLNSAGRGAQLIGSGEASASNDTLRFEVEDAPAFSFALLSSGAAQAPANAANPCFGLASGIPSPSFDGLRCVVQDFQRHGARPVDANGAVGATTNGWGLGSGPPGGLVAFFGFQAGQTRYFQVIYRDDPMLGCQTGLNTTQGWAVAIRP